VEFCHFAGKVNANIRSKIQARDETYLPFAGSEIFICKPKNAEAVHAIEARPKLNCPTPTARTRRAETLVKDPRETGFGRAKYAIRSLKTLRQNLAHAGCG
jgi:hypothetical protein